MPTIPEAEWRAALQRAGDAEQRAAEAEAHGRAVAERCLKLEEYAQRAASDVLRTHKEADQLGAELDAARRDSASAWSAHHDAVTDCNRLLAEVERLKAELVEARRGPSGPLAVEAAEERGARWALDAYGYDEHDAITIVRAAREREAAASEPAPLKVGERVPGGYRGLAAVERAKEPAPLKVGDRVRVVRCCPGEIDVCCERRVGHVGELLGIDGGDEPFRVEWPAATSRGTSVSAVERVEEPAPAVAPAEVAAVAASDRPLTRGELVAVLRHWIGGRFESERVTLGDISALIKQMEAAP